MVRVFCDFLTVTVPVSHDAALKDVSDEFAAALGSAPGHEPGVWLTPSGGALVYKKRPMLAQLQATGAALADLRAKAVFADYLGALGALPHRVTRLDATCDRPIRAAPHIHRIWDAVKAGAVSLSRKRLDPRLCDRRTTVALYPDEPLETGTLYLPLRVRSRSDQYLTVYDKRQERIAKGYADPGPLLRLEASASRGKGATLADAWDPVGLHFAIVPPEVFPHPSDVPPWAPNGESWSGHRPTPATRVQRLERLLEGSLGQALREAADFPGGRAACLRLVDKLFTGTPGLLREPA